MHGDVEKTFPHGQWLETLVAQSVAEDVGSGDVSTAVLATGQAPGVGYVVARESGRMAGLPLMKILFAQLDSAVVVECLVSDGTSVHPGQKVACWRGPVASILTGERTVLNFLQHLGGIASLTAEYVAAVAGTKCQVLDTRKTLPGYRLLAKYAVRCGGGHNHRLGLYDRIMLKDNHWAAAGGQIEALIRRARHEFPDLPLEVEVDSLAQLQQVLPLAVDWVLLDNLDYGTTSRAVAMRDAAGVPTLLESSGNVTLATIGEYARAGVDAASVGRLTHSAPALDLGLDMAPDE